VIHRRRDDGPGLKRQWLVAGLGNPGDRYRDTRHNIGFATLDQLAKTHSIPWDRAVDSTIQGVGAIEGVDVVLAKPMAYMNHSGPPLADAAERFKISSQQVLVIHDDMDLALGRIKIKAKGGHGGHRGLQSLMAALDADGNFARLRVGIGRPPAGCDPVDHVLGRFTQSENEVLADAITSATEAVATILTRGVRDGMNRFNRSDFLR
jgi:PTH1 family peptidyl-tRNA hydrolase